MDLQLAREEVRTMLDKLQEEFDNQWHDPARSVNPNLRRQIDALQTLLGQPVLSEQTLMESMAVAVLQKDVAAARAIRDLFDERVDRDAQNAQHAQWRTTCQSISSARGVYQMPEFQAFARRIGLQLDALTVDVVIELYWQGPVNIIQRYRAVDTQGPQQGG